MKAKQFADLLEGRYAALLKDKTLDENWPGAITACIDQVITREQILFRTRADSGSTPDAIRRIKLWKGIWIKWRQIVRLCKPFMGVTEQLFVDYLRAKNISVFAALVHNDCLPGFKLREEDVLAVNQFISEQRAEIERQQSGKQTVSEAVTGVLDQGHVHGPDCNHG